MSGSWLNLNSVSKIYRSGGTGEVPAVRDMDLSFEKGEIVALLGSSGCGKTSTLRMIAGFEQVTKGSISLDGREIHGLPPASRNVAMAFEGYSLYPPLTVRENIAFALKSKRLPASEINSRVNEIAKLLEIEEILEKYPSSISGGQQQRASLGRALIRDAALHLLDEPMGQLEPQLRALLRGRIKFFIKRRGLTAILVTHDQTEANALADRIAVMEDGELQQFDTPENLKDRPANLFTGTFIGEPPMNVLLAKIGKAGTALRFNFSETEYFDFPESEFQESLRSDLCANRSAMIGIRPHAVQLVNRGSRARVTASQWLGDQTHVVASFAGSSIVSVSHDRVKYNVGDEIGVEIASRDLHIFDPKTGRALSHGSETA